MIDISNRLADEICSFMDEDTRDPTCSECKIEALVLLPLFQKLLREQEEATLQPIEAMIDEMSEAKAFGILTHPQGEPEFPISYFIEQLEEAIDKSKP